MTTFNPVLSHSGVHLDFQITFVSADTKTQGHTSMQIFIHTITFQHCPYVEKQ